MDMANLQEAWLGADAWIRVGAREWRAFPLKEGAIDWDSPIDLELTLPSSSGDPEK